jgi:putative membrane protein
MTTIATAEQSRKFAQNRLLQYLVTIYMVMWAAMAISPVDRMDWLLENLLVFVFCGAAISSVNRFQLSDLSYLLLFVFMTLHAIGAHYTYGQVPVGYWIRDQFGWNRNDFDRIAHFSYGLLFAYPIREVFLRTSDIRGFWSFFLPVDVILATSAFFELLEAWIAQIVKPELANQYLGSQGDYFDAQNDMASALMGAILAMSFLAWKKHRDRLLALDC